MDMLNIQLTSIPIWVKFYNIPLEYWTNTSLGHIASVVGNPLHLDSLTENQSKLSFARICVEVGVDCEFPKSVLLDLGNDKYSNNRIEYPRAPQCCPNCKLFGHSQVNCHAMKGPSCISVTINPEENVNMAGEDDSAGARKVPLDMGEGSRKESTGDTLNNAGDSVACSILENRETIKHAEVNLPKLPGNTFECLAQSEEECPSVGAKSKATSRSEDFSDTSPIIDTFKHIKRVDELDFTPVPPSKKKLKKLKKRDLVNKHDTLGIQS